LAGTAGVLLAWVIGDDLLHPPRAAPLLWPAILAAMAVLLVLPTIVLVRRRARGLRFRFQAFAGFAELVRAAARLGGGFIGGLAVEVFLRGGLTDAGTVRPGALLAAAWHAAAIAALLAWRPRHQGGPEPGLRPRPRGDRP
jgi:hypothetical protein